MHLQTFWYAAINMQPSCNIYLFIARISTEFSEPHIQRLLRLFENLYNLLKMQNTFTTANKVIIFLITPSVVEPVEIGHEDSHPLIYSDGVLQDLFQIALQHLVAVPPYMTANVSAGQATWENHTNPSTITDPQFGMNDLFRIIVH